MVPKVVGSSPIIHPFFFQPDDWLFSGYGHVILRGVFPSLSGSTTRFDRERFDGAMKARCPLATGYTTRPTKRSSRCMAATSISGHATPPKEQSGIREAAR